MKKKRLIVSSLVFFGFVYSVIVVMPFRYVPEKARQHLMSLQCIAKGLDCCSYDFCKIKYLTNITIDAVVDNRALPYGLDENLLSDREFKEWAYQIFKKEYYNRFPNSSVKILKEDGSHKFSEDSQLMKLTFILGEPVSWSRGQKPLKGDADVFVLSERSPSKQLLNKYPEIKTVDDLPHSAKNISTVSKAGVWNSQTPDIYRFNIKWSLRRAIQGGVGHLEPREEEISAYLAKFKN